MIKFGVVIPTLNGGNKFEDLMVSLAKQTYQPQKILIIDSESNDATIETAQAFQCEVFSILRSDFNHGGTRQLSIELLEEYEMVVFLTQDAVLADCYSLEKIIQCFQDPEVGIAYGRQLPNLEAKPLEAHARNFNYLAKSYIYSKENIKDFGMKTAFCSNSFAAYRVAALKEVGGFPSWVILSEDMYVAAKMLLQGHKIAYCAEATVYHSHAYSISDEMKRYFDIGVFQSREKWILEHFGRAEGEGVRFVKSELRYLFQGGYYFLIVEAIIRTGSKFLGYQLGKCERFLPVSWKRKISMHKNYWLVKRKLT